MAMLEMLILDTNGDTGYANTGIRMLMLEMIVLDVSDHPYNTRN